MKVEIRLEQYDPWHELSVYQKTLASGSYGATAVFIGTMRDLMKETMSRRCFWSITRA